MRDKLDKQFNRVYISHKDLEKCLAYFSSAEKALSIEDWDSAGGLIAAGIIAYARPFSGNEPHDRAVPMPPFSISLLDEPERDLHKRIIELRNTVIAHSDAEMNPAHTIEYRETGFLVSSRLYDPLRETTNLNQFITLAKKVYKIFEDKMFQLSCKINSHDG